MQYIRSYTIVREDAHDTIRHVVIATYYPHYPILIKTEMVCKASVDSSYNNMGCETLFSISVC